MLPLHIRFALLSIVCILFIEPIDSAKNSISDGRRSSSSSNAFFNLLDGNGDATLTASEIRRFIMERFRGDTRLDEDAEVDLAVQSVVSKLDRHDDGSLSIGDMNSHLLNLDSLLNLDETADWVIYACQLPPSVGKIFRDNRVTGSEFAELIENNGELLEAELGIPKATWRKKLLKHMRLKLLGIGSVPLSVPSQSFVIDPPSGACDVINLSWSPSPVASPSRPIFPIHSYRVQRKVKASRRGAAIMPVLPDSSNNSLDMTAALADDIPPPLSSRNPYKWNDIYNGIENTFVDVQLQSETTYDYRVQAWNSVGRSQWSTVSYTTPFSSTPGCPPAPSSSSFFFLPNTSTQSTFNDNSNKPRLWQYISNMYFTTQVVMGIFQGFFTLIAILAAFMRLKRGSSTSTGFGITQLTVFPWLWRGINKLTMKTLGVEIIPQAMLGDPSLNRIKSERDLTYGMAGLAGTGSSASADGRKMDNSFAKHMQLRKSVISPGPSRSPSLENFLSPVDEKLGTPDSGKRSGTPPKISTRRRSFFTKTKSTPSVASTPTSSTKSFKDAAKAAGVSTPPFAKIPKSVPPLTAMNSSPGGNHERYWDDHTRCNVCEKKFKLMFRHRHHCARCLSAFCHKHGRTTHTNLTSCKVPGTCICDRCILLEKVAINHSAERLE